MVGLSCVYEGHIESKSFWFASSIAPTTANSLDDIPRPLSTRGKVHKERSILLYNWLRIYSSPLLLIQLPRSKCGRGSFLKHNSSTLRRLSSLTASTPSISGPGRTFVFQKSNTEPAPSATAMATPAEGRPQKVSAQRQIWGSVRPRVLTLYTL